MDPNASFPIDPHFAHPFIHWFDAPIARAPPKDFSHHTAGNLTDAGAAHRGRRKQSLVTEGVSILVF